MGKFGQKLIVSRWVDEIVQVRQLIRDISIVPLILCASVDLTLVLENSSVLFIYIFPSDGVNSSSDYSWDSMKAIYVLKFITLWEGPCIFHKTEGKIFLFNFYCIFRESVFCYFFLKPCYVYTKHNYQLLSQILIPCLYPDSDIESTPNRYLRDFIMYTFELLPFLLPLTV